MGPIALNLISAPSLGALPSPQPANIGDMVPIYGTYKDAEEFVENPTLFNAGMTAWGAINDAIFLFTKNGALRLLLNAGKQYVKSTAKKRAIQLANPRAVARVSQQRSNLLLALRLARLAVVKNKKQDFIVESLDNTFLDNFNKLLPPLWQKYSNKQ